METTQHAEQVKVELDETVGEMSKAEIAVTQYDGDNYLSRTTTIYTSADPVEGEIWLSMEQRFYASLGVSDPIVSRASWIERHITRAEAEALVEVLRAELAKF